MRLTGKHYAGGAVGVVALATTLVAGFEGYRNHVYRDVGGVETYCFGETEHPKPGHTYTRQECTAQLAGRVQQFDSGVRACVHRPLPVKVEAAFVSLAYNIGIGGDAHGGFCGSSVAALANTGDLTSACNHIPAFNRVGKTVVPGLTVRRGAERDLCLEGVSEGLPK